MSTSRCKRIRLVFKEKETIVELEPLYNLKPTQPSCSAVDSNCTVEAVVINAKERLLEKMYDNQYNTVIGYVTWLTDSDILKALANKDACQFIIEKDDFLTSNNKGLCQLYRRIKGFESNSEAVRCTTGSQSVKVEHQKFMVFGNIVHDEETLERKMNPKAVWIGMENGIWIESPTIAQVYHNTWLRLSAISENLRWDSQVTNDS